MILLGFDVGSSSIKAALVDAESGATIARAQYPDREMEIESTHAGWAEQNPELWWDCVVKLTRQLLHQYSIDPDSIKAIGISYQMHGLVLVDENLNCLRPSIIWCDSRAVEIGDKAFARIGQAESLRRMLNSPGNFTASKLRWVREQEPELYKKIKYFMLPGDYIAMKMTGEPATTVSGLSEGILWDFLEQEPSKIVLQDYDIAPDLIPTIVPTFGNQGTLSDAAAAELGLKAGTSVAYRAGDQPNNAMSLNVLEPGEVAATGGTSGVVYALADRPIFDPLSRVNGFAHVNYSNAQPNIGVLMCINGAGITYNWLRQQTGNASISYADLEQHASKAPVGAGGVSMLPFGNGAERIFSNQDIGAHVSGLRFNTHNQSHLLRAGIEGMAFAFVYGINILKGMGLSLNVMRAGNDNLFQSKIFSETIATLSGSRIEVLEATGAIGAAKAAGYGVGIYKSLREALGQTKVVNTHLPLSATDAYQEAYERWTQYLNHHLKTS